MGPGLGLRQVMASDAALAIVLNRLARGSVLGRRLAVASASWLASVEVALMGTLVVAGRTRSAGRMLAGVAVVYVASEGLGRVWRRERPFANHAEVEVLVPHTPRRSFPSRHVASGVAMAAIGGRAHPFLGLAMSTTAWLLGLSRVATGLHYPTDVLAGALLGRLVGHVLRD